MTAVLGIGELLWDLLPAGPRLGGAPFNVVVHLRRLGFEAAFLSAVGDDDLGRRALADMDTLGVRTDLVSVVPDTPSGTVGVELDTHGHPTYAIHSPAAYERVDAIAAARVEGSGMRPDAIVFGTLAQRFATVREATRAVLAASPTAIRVYDVNLREGCWTPSLVDDLLGDVTVLKLNDAELPVIGAALDLPAGDPVAFARAATARYGIGSVCVTQGAAGATAWDGSGEARVEGLPVDVVDTVGAGDAFTAGFTGSLLQGAGLADALRAGNALGALVASRAGAVPAWTASELDEVLSRGIPA